MRHRIQAARPRGLRVRSRPAATAGAPVRVREQVRDGAVVVGFSLATSAAATATVALATRLVG